ncbi:MAG: carboxylesterase/lipase family protein [Dehalococcoidia bacterium]
MLFGCGDRGRDRLIRLAVLLLGVVLLNGCTRGSASRIAPTPSPTAAIRPSSTSVTAIATPIGAAATGTGPVVQTDKGAVQGTAGADGRAFLGIPYAAPPVGELRFAAPAQHAPWTGTLQATKPGSTCAQLAGPLSARGFTSEDCLFLNIYTPAAGNTLPVIVWIHGGSFTGGSGNEYVGTHMSSAGNVIVVTINYRLGLLGFLASPALDSGTGDTGSYGIEDQQAALRWVHANIAAFGGDPQNVTMAGESAGAISVCANLASPGASGLYAKAIVESGPCAAPFLTLSLAETLDRAVVADSLGCTGDGPAVSACLRSLPISKIEDVQRSLPPNVILAPAVGGSVVPVQPAQALAGSTVPLLIGGNTLEQALFLPRRALTAADYEAEVRRTYGINADAVLQQYPVSNYATPFLALATVESDDLPIPTLALCADLASAVAQAASPAPVYLYEFADPVAPSAFPGLPAGPWHATELLYLWRDPARQGGLGLGGAVPAASRALSDQMIGYWTQFAATGNPNRSGLPDWPRFRGSTETLRLVPGAVQPEDIAALHHCTFWQTLGYR